MDQAGGAPVLRPWHDGDVVAGRYEVLEFLGAGGMGLVYRCRDRQTSRVRAIKTLRLDLGEEARALVMRLLQSEATALGRVESDFVVRIFDARVGAELEHPFVVMELLRGRDLEQVLREGRPHKSQALSWLWQAACGLKAIHAEGVVHRDLKPANLFLNERDDGTRELKILDFSISRILDQARGRTTVIVGTRGYMSPEQAAGYDVDHRADIFALGQVARALVEEDEAFASWHRKATAADRRERFSSATEAVEALAGALGLALPGRRSLSPQDASLSSATTVFAPPPSRLRAPPWLLAAGAAGATLLTVLVLRGLPAEEVSGKKASEFRQAAPGPSAPASAEPRPVNSITFLAFGTAAPSAAPSFSVRSASGPPPRRTQPSSARPPARNGPIFW